MKRILTWVGLIISAVLLWYALSQLHLPEVWGYLRKARYWWIVPGVAVYFFGVWARTWRWHYMLRPFKSVPLIRLFPVVCIGYAGNNIYPARAGEVIRSFVLKQTEDIPMSGSLATVLIERLFDGLVMLMFVFVALPFAPNIPTVYRNWVIGFSLLFGIAMAVFIFVAARPQLATAALRLDRLSYSSATLPLQIRWAVRSLHAGPLLAPQWPRCVDDLHDISGDLAR